MRKIQEKGSFIEWLLMLFAISVVIFAIVIPRDKRFTFNMNPMIIGGTSGGGWVLGQQGSTPTPVGTSGTVTSPTISISTGNGSYEDQPANEYITIENRGGSAVDVTGWRIENSKNLRAYAMGDQQVHYASDTGIIPQGAKIVSPTGNSLLSNIILNPGERIIVTTGSPGNLTSFPLMSFKENECTAYLGENYTFASGVDLSCVRPSNEVGARSLDLACQDFIETLQSCRVPKFDAIDSQGHTQDRNGRTCTGCVNGKVGLSSSCQNFMKQHFSYQGCLVNHMSDSNFEGTTWHVYLYKSWEMWAKNHEVVSLYDAQNRLVTSYSY